MSETMVANSGLVMPESHGLSEVERVVDTFIAPSKTFNDILRSASWWLPFVLMVLFSLAAAWTVDKQVGYEKVFENQVQSSPKLQERVSAADPAQRAQIMKMGAMQMKVGGYGAPFFITIFLLIYSLIVWASFNFGLGAQTVYKQVLAVTFYAALPYLFLSIITYITVRFGANADAYDMKNPVGTNIGYYLTEAPPMVRAALASVDVVRLWSVALQVIGMAIISKKTILQSAVVVGILWAVGVLFGAVGAAFS